MGKKPCQFVSTPLEKKNDFSIKIKVWGVISQIGPCILKRYNGVMTGVSHSELLLEVLYHLKDVFDNKKLFFQQGNARTQTCEVAIKMLKELNIIRLPWPSQSPDISLTENFWSIMRQELWKKVTTEHKFSLYRGIPKRIEKVLEFHGQRI